jgi:predicted RNase H-like HicB family nuclease
MTLSVQCERDEDGRWLAKMPGAIAYGDTIEEAMARVEALALQAAAEEVKRSEAGTVGVRHAGESPIMCRSDADTHSDADPE